MRGSTPEYGESTKRCSSDYIMIVYCYQTVPYSAVWGTGVPPALWCIFLVPSAPTLGQPHEFAEQAKRHHYEEINFTLGDLAMDTNFMIHLL